MDRYLRMWGLVAQNEWQLGKVLSKPRVQTLDLYCGGFWNEAI